MSNIQIYSANGLPIQVENKLDVTEAKIAALSINNDTNPRMIDQNTTQWSELLKNILLKAQIKLGLKPKDEKENKLLMECINNDLGSKFPNLTRREVYAALDAGLDGRFLKEGETSVFFNPSYLVQWIRAWIEDVKKPVMKKVIEAQHNWDLEVPPSEQDKLIKSFQIFIKAIKDSLAAPDKIYQDYGGIVFGLLEKLEMIEPVTKDEIDKIAVKQLQIAQISFDRSKVRNMKSVLAEKEITFNSAINSVKAIAERMAVDRKIRMIITWEESDIVEYLTMINEALNEYLSKLTNQ